MSRDAWFDQIARRLDRLVLPAESRSYGRTPAAVALILQHNCCGSELLFIQRAHRQADPWSGNIGFPGGRFESTDLSLRHTAERETQEEVGIALPHSARYLGHLADIVGANLPVQVSCFVYGLTGPVQPVISDEVQDLFWYGLDELSAPQRQLQATVQFGERRLQTPAVDLGLPGKPVLWGITYRLVSRFRELLESDVAAPLSYELPV